MLHFCTFSLKLKCPWNDFSVIMEYNKEIKIKYNIRIFDIIYVLPIIVQLIIKISISTIIFAV